MQPPIRGAQGAHHLVERFEIARDHPIMAHFAVAVALRDRHVDRFLVDIEAHGHATVLHTYLLVCGTVRSVRHSASSTT